MISGKVKWFNNDKGYGFLEVEGKDDIFVHYSAIKSKGYRSLLEGQYVNFELINTAKGLQAKNVEEIYALTSFACLPNSPDKYILTKAEELLL